MVQMLSMKVGLFGFFFFLHGHILCSGLFSGSKGVIPKAATNRFHGELKKTPKIEPLFFPKGYRKLFLFVNKFNLLDNFNNILIWFVLPDNKLPLRINIWRSEKEINFIHLSLTMYATQEESRVIYKLDKS